MPQHLKPLLIPLEEAIARYRGGELISSIAAAAGVSAPTLTNRLAKAGCHRRDPHRVYMPDRARLPMDTITARYLAGESVKALAAEYNVSRGTIGNRFAKAGVPIRGRSAASVVRMKKEGPEGRARLVEAAQKARRQSPNSWGSRLGRAKSREKGYYKRLCIGEIDVACLLSERSYFPDLQRALGPYNVDLAVDPVAVEVHRHPTNPLSLPAQRERTKHLTDAGWHVVYVWLCPLPGRAWSAPNAVLADKLVAFIEEAKANPSPVGEYRVIRGSGEDVPSLSLDPNQDALIPPPRRTNNIHG